MRTKSFTLNRSEALLFLVDLQTRMLAAMENPKACVKNTRVLLAAAKCYEIPLVMTEQYPKGLGATEESIREAIKDRKALIAEKTAYDGVTPEVAHFLEKSERKQIVVMGIESHICVLQTVRSLLEKGYEVFLPIDAISSRDIQNKENSISLMREMGAVISNTESLLFDLIKDARDPHFKELQALIK